MNCKKWHCYYGLIKAHSSIKRLTEQHLWWYGESSEGVAIQDVCPCVVNDNVRSDLVQGPLRVELHLLKILWVFSAPVQLHLPLYGSWRYTEGTQASYTNKIVIKKVFWIKFYRNSFKKSLQKEFLVSKFLRNVEVGLFFDRILQHFNLVRIFLITIAKG